MAERTFSLPHLPASFPRGAVIPVALVALWAVLTETGLWHGPLVVSPSQVLAVPFLDPSGKEIWASVGASLLRLAIGTAVGGVIGLAAGLFVGMSRRGGLTLSPTLHTFRQIALFAWIPLLTSWFGNSETTKICFVAISTFFPIFLATEQGLRGTPATLGEVATVLHLSRRRRITALLLPAALPAIAVGVQIALIASWVGTVGAEYAIGNGRGLGSYIASARDQFRMDIVLVGVAVLAAVGAGLYYLSRAAIARLTPWNVPRNR